MRWMVHFTFIPDSAIPSLVPAERARVQELIRDGHLQMLSLSADNARGWMVLVGASREEIEEMLMSLPLYPYLRPEVIELSSYDPVSER